MKEYQVVPKVGVGPVKLGMHRAEVHSAMGTPPVRFRKTETERYETDAYAQNGFQIFYSGDEPRVEYIELSSDSDFVASYKGVDVFGTKAESIVTFIAQDALFDQNDWELGYSYIFPALELGVWRPVVPGSADDPEGRYFSTIGIGMTGYYSNTHK